MKTKIIAAIALCGTALSPIMSTAAFAVPVYDTPVADVTTMATMNSTCSAYLAQLNTLYAPQEFTSVAVENITYSVVVAATPTSSVEIPNTRLPVGPQTGANAAGATADLVNGKSPNIFTTNAKAVYAGGSSYQTTDTYATTITFNYFCTPTEKVTTPGTPTLESQGDCASRVAQDDTIKALPEYTNPGQWCQVLTHRLTVPGEPTVDYVVRYNLSKGFEVTQAGTATDTGVGYDTSPWTDQNSSVQAVVCISPTKNPGTWRPANGYTGGQCSRATYDILNSTGTPSNSLPTS